MKNIILAILMLSIFIGSKSFSQQTIIDFTVMPNKCSDPPACTVWDPHYWDNSGCPLYHSFGPDPTPLHGHNIRTVGDNLVGNSLILEALNLYASGNLEDDGNYYNSNLSIEYSFAANKTYIVDINGYLDNTWGINGQTHNSNTVFWVRLDDSPVIVTSAQNKCEQSLTAIDRKIDRYSKLIADPVGTMSFRSYRVKFSPLTAKNALKITFDPTPVDPEIRFSKTFRLRNVTIKEVPYEEDSPSRPFYDNVTNGKLGTNTRNNPNYYIPYTPPPRGSTPPQQQSKNFSIESQQWHMGNDGRASILVSEIIPGFNASAITFVSVLGDPYMLGNREVRPLIDLPGQFHGNNYSFVFLQTDVLIIANNSTSTSPSLKTDFMLQYTP